MKISDNLYLYRSTKVKNTVAIHRGKLETFVFFGHKPILFKGAIRKINIIVLPKRITYQLSFRDEQVHGQCYKVVLYKGE